MDRTTGVPFPAESQLLFALVLYQTSALYKELGQWIWPLVCIYFRNLNCVELQSPIWFHDMLLRHRVNFKSWNSSVKRLNTGWSAGVWFLVEQWILYIPLNPGALSISTPGFKGSKPEANHSLHFSGEVSYRHAHIRLPQSYLQLFTVSSCLN